MQNDAKPEFNRVQRTDVRRTAKKALLQLLEPLAGFVSDSGLSASEFNALFREAAVRSAAANQLGASNRVNISGIAATTGISRADVSKFLRVNAGTAVKSDDTQQQSTSRILAAWHEDPKFTSPNGQPMDLSIYGRGPTFEALTKRYGRGIPTRAVLDELVRTGAIELLATQKIRTKGSMAIEQGMSAQVVKAFGERSSELLSTMLMNMRQPKAPKFVASVSDTAILPGALRLLRRELTAKSADFLSEVQATLAARQKIPSSKRREQESTKVSVTIFYHESLVQESSNSQVVNKRRNFRRHV